MSTKLAIEIRLGLTELDDVARRLARSVSRSEDDESTEDETDAACARLHSFCTGIEKIFSLVARDLDGRLPSGGDWHKALVEQMVVTTDRRPAVITAGLADQLGEFLAFRHLYRNTSLVRMRWDRLAPLLEASSDVHTRVRQEIGEFLEFLERK